MLRRKHQRRHLRTAIFLAVFKHRSHLASALVKTNYRAVPSAAENHVGVKRIGSDVSVFKAPYGVPILRKNLSEVAAAEYACGAAVLLRAINAIRKQIVSGDVVELSRRLVVPRTPALPAIHADDGALINAEQHAGRVSRIDPQHVEVIPAWSAYVCLKRLSAIRGTVERGLGHVEHVRMAGISKDAAEIFAANNARILRALLPSGSAIVRPEEALVKDGIEASPAVARRNSYAHPLAGFFRQPFAPEWLPGGSFIG